MLELRYELLEPLQPSLSGMSEHLFLRLVQIQSKTRKKNITDESIWLQADRKVEKLYFRVSYSRFYGKNPFGDEFKLSLHSHDDFHLFVLAPEAMKEIKKRRKPK